MKVIKCDICNSDMKQVQQLQSIKNKNGAKSRVRRFECSNEACDYKETVFADGFRDNVTVPNQLKQKVNKIYKQQSENQLNSIIFEQ